MDDPLGVSREQTWGSCAGLITALYEADKCKDFARAGQAEEACIHFVKACSYSVHALETLRSCASIFVGIMADAEETYAQHIEVVERPAILQAVQVMLFGYQIQALPDSTRAVLHQLNSTICFNTATEDSYGLSSDDVSWVYHLGCFKTASYMITQSLVEDDEDAQELCYDVVERSLVNMQLQRRCHPTFLEAYSMYTQLLSLRRALQQPQDEESNTDTSELAPGEVLVYVQQCLPEMGQQDPAAIMHLLLQAIYITLKDCNAKPDPDTQGRLIWAANVWQDFYLVLREITGFFGNLWHNVRDGMQAAMLLLGHTFPLRKCLKGHILVDMIEKTHTIVQTKLKRQEQKDQNDLKTENTEPVAQQSNHADSGSTCKCERCGRRLWQEENIIFMSEKVCKQFFAENDLRRPIPCRKCHAVAYCSSNCMRLGRADHKTNCMRHQLKNKLAERKLSELE